MFSGKIVASKIANALGIKAEIPTAYSKLADVLKSKPGKNVPRDKKGEIPADAKVYPVFHCYEEIPCNPCTSACIKGFIKLKGESGTMMDIPYFEPGGGNVCSGCMKCVAICPGLAVTIVDKRKALAGKAHVLVPFELIPSFKIGGKVRALDSDGAFVSQATVIDIIDKKWQDKTLLIKLEVDEAKAEQIAGVAYQEKQTEFKNTLATNEDRGECIVCRCEKVKDKEIRALIRDGIMDMNVLKTVRCMMGACGGKTCTTLIKRIFAEEGFDSKKVVEPSMRPLNAEISLGTFAGLESNSEKVTNYEADV
jgi:sarcosine oxidase subunit alpha